MARAPAKTLPDCSREGGRPPVQQRQEHRYSVVRRPAVGGEGSATAVAKVRHGKAVYGQSETGVPDTGGNGELEAVPRPGGYT